MSKRSSRVGIEHLSQKARERALAEYARQTVRCVKLAPVPPGAEKRLPPGWKNEMDFRQAFSKFEYWSRYRWVHHGLTFHLANGHRYTPDWVLWDGSEVAMCIEVKGPHKFHSESRARLAFDQCAIEHPNIRWQWWRKTKTGYVEE